MKRVIVAAVLCASGLAVAEPPEKLHTLLGLIEQAPTRAELDAASGGDAAPALQRLAKDDSAPTLLRQRATQALGFYPGAATTDVLLALATSQHPALRKGAIGVLGSLEPDARIEAALIAALDDTEVSVRKSAIRSLSARGRATKALERRLTIETDRHARQLLSSALGRLQ